MLPVCFSVYGVEIHSYGLLGAVGFLVVALIGIYQARKLGWSKDGVVDVIFWTALSALLGARILFLLTSDSSQHAPLQWLNIRSGGLSFFGALIAGIPVMAWMCRRRQLPFFAFADVFSTAFPFGHAISRIGCFLAGCCYGAPSFLPWAVTFSDPQSVAPLGVRLHPTQLYEAVGLLLIGVLTSWFYRYRQFNGQGMWLYLIAYAVLRGIIEVFRDDPRGWFLESWFGPLVTLPQAIAVFVALVAGVLFFIVAKRKI